MYDYELFDVEDGYGFRVLRDGSPVIVQEFHPSVDGHVVMTAEEAVLEEQTIIGRLTHGD